MKGKKLGKGTKALQGGRVTVHTLFLEVLSIKLYRLTDTSCAEAEEKSSMVEVSDLIIMGGSYDASRNEEDKAVKCLEESLGYLKHKNIVVVSIPHLRAHGEVINRAVSCLLVYEGRRVGRWEDDLSTPLSVGLLNKNVCVLSYFQPPTKAGRCCWSVGFLEDLPFAPPLHYGTAPYLALPSAALKRPANLFVLGRWGKSLESSGRYNDLFNCYEQALEVFPGHEVLLSNLGGHLYRKKSAEWLTAISAHFPKKLREFYGIAISQLQAVSSGVKPGFLWDIPVAVSASQLVLLLNSLRHKGLVTSDVRVVSVAGDMLLMNVPVIRARMARHLEDGTETPVYQFVDVSESKLMALSTGSSFFPKISQMLSSLLSHLTDSGDEPVITVPLEADWCVNTVVGVFIGYPVVYWYDVSKPASLSMVPLTVFELSVKSEDRWYVIYDFSVPSSIAVSFKSHINDWHRRTSNHDPTLMGCVVLHRGKGICSMATSPPNFHTLILISETKENLSRKSTLFHSAPHAALYNIVLSNGDDDLLLRVAFAADCCTPNLPQPIGASKPPCTLCKMLPVICSITCIALFSQLVFPVGSHLDFLTWELCQTRCWSVIFLGDLTFPSPLHSSTTPYSTHFTLIDSQDPSKPLPPLISCPREVGPFWPLDYLPGQITAVQAVAVVETSNQVDPSKGSGIGADVGRGASVGTNDDEWWHSRGGDATTTWHMKFHIAQVVVGERELRDAFAHNTVVPGGRFVKIYWCGKILVTVEDVS
ncbi:hypothetical protein PR048_016757 [Dryococelus australis]|uniref:Uncharacterized protein n=1 Tax=Dryococelus australis TaxID=614101 RepID=A0ABQ9H7K4_9NEOP|nr:hypothetical protein PR048_016757 [Dryococelus australis]